MLSTKKLTAASKAVAAAHIAVMNTTATAAYTKAVAAYTVEIINAAADGVAEIPADMTPAALRAFLLNGAANWTQYSAGGCSLVASIDICRRLTDTEDEAAALIKAVSGARLLLMQAKTLEGAAAAIFSAYFALTA